MKPLRTILALNEMRDESKKIAKAFAERRAAKGARTDTDGQKLRLHKNVIAWHGDNGEIHTTLAGWNTTTTRERLNALCDHVGAKGRFCQKKGVPHFGDKPIDAHDSINIMKEDVDQLDELSKKTLGSYIKRAHHDKSNIRGEITTEINKSGKQWTKNKKLANKYKNRSNGIDRATDKLVKEDAELLDEKRGIAGFIQRWQQRDSDKPRGLKFGNQLRKVKSGERMTVASEKRKSKVLGTSFADPRLAANNKQKIRINSVKPQAGNPLGKKTRAPGKFLKTLPSTAKKPKAAKSVAVKPAKVNSFKPNGSRLTGSLITRAMTPKKIKPAPMPKINTAKQI